MPELNFLPQDQIQDKKVQAVSGKLKVLAAVLGVLCVTIGIAGTAFTIYKGTAISELEKQESELKTQVLAQESSEQTLVFLRDRLSKIQVIEAKNSNNGDYLAEKSTLATFSPIVNLKQLNLTATDSNFSLIVPDSITLVDVLQKMKTKQFESGFIDTISYNAGLGYEVKFKIK